jgi:hypothetical protein
LPGSDDSLLHETRANNSRSGTPREKTANETWLKVQSRAPVNYPADYHGLMMSLPEVQSIKPSDWLESGLNAEGVDQLPHPPDRIIAAAMSWNAEDYAQTKCTFFNQYDPTVRDLSKWLRVLKFGGSRSKEKGERLLAMWGSLGWLDAQDATAADEVNQPSAPIAPKTRTRTSIGANKVRSTEEKETSSKRSAHWTPEEDDAMMRIMDTLEKDPKTANTTSMQRADMCGLRLKQQFGTDRTGVAISIRYHKNRRDQEAVQSIEETTPPGNSATAGSLHNLALNASLVARPPGTEFRAINDPIRNTFASDDRVDSANPSFIDDSKKKPERWTEREDKAMLKILKDIEADATLSQLYERDRCEICSKRLLSEYGIERTMHSVRKRWKKITNTDTPAKRKIDDDDGPNEDEPLMNCQKRRQTVSRFVAELYDAGEE